MPSIKSKMTTMMIYVIVIAMAISAFLSVAALRSVGSRDADQLLLLHAPHLPVLLPDQDGGVPEAALFQHTVIHDGQVMEAAVRDA